MLLDAIDNILQAPIEELHQAQEEFNVCRRYASFILLAHNCIIVKKICSHPPTDYAPLYTYLPVATLLLMMGPQHMF